MEQKATICQVIAIGCLWFYNHFNFALILYQEYLIFPRLGRLSQDGIATTGALPTTSLRPITYQKYSPC